MLVNIDVTVQFRPNPPSPTSGGFISPVLSRIIREETSRLRAAVGEAVPPAGYANANANGGSLRIKKQTRQKISNGLCKAGKCNERIG